MNAAAPYIRVDLHLHSSFSDGESSPEQLAEKLAAAGVRWAALVDHETTRGLGRFQAALGRFQIQSIPGTEIEVQSLDGPIHLLAYGFDPQDRTFQRYLASLRSPFWAARSWIRSLRSTAQKHPHAADNGHNNAASAIERIHQAGGIALLAHPLDSLPGMYAVERALEALVADGLDGIEVHYKPYAKPDQDALAALAAKHRLIAGAGSDYHGKRFSNGLSPGVEMPEHDLERFLDAARQRSREVV